MNITVLILSITVIINFILGIVVLIKSTQRRVKISFALITLALSLWTIPIIIFQLIPGGSDVTTLFRMAFIGPSLLGYLFLYFSLTFPDGKEPEIHLLCLFPVIFFLVFISTDFIIIKSFKTTTGVYIIQRGPGNSIFAIYYVSYVAMSLWNLFIKYKKSYAMEKEKIKYIFLGAILLSVFAIITNLVLPLAGFNKLNRIGPVASLFLVGCTAYAILKHQLMDIRIVIKKTIDFTVPFTIALIALWIINDLLPIPQIYKYIIITLVGGLFIRYYNYRKHLEFQEKQAVLEEKL